MTHPSSELAHVVRLRLRREDTRQAQLRSLYARTVTATDPTGYVQAVMRLDGRLDSLQINPHAMYDLTAAELAAACTAAAHATWRARADTLAAGLEALGETRPGDEPDPDTDLLRFDR